jgi:hypothetical protein
MVVSLPHKERERERERESWIEILAAIANEGDQVLLDYK